MATNTVVNCVFHHVLPEISAGITCFQGISLNFYLAVNTNHMIHIDGHTIDPSAIYHVSKVIEGLSGFEFSVKLRPDTEIRFIVSNPAFIASLRSLNTSAPHIENRVLQAEANNMREFIEDSMKVKEYEPTMLMKIAKEGSLLAE